MFRKVFVAESAAELTINLPHEFLHNRIEVIAFEVDDDSESIDLAKKKAARNAVQFFKNYEIDMSDFKFDRDEANER
ncbi:hypothetical protein [Dyadobacter sp. CY323]|uniref:hypothetical protein n=1 Tax=Dyadobacter sp. CY323 TaxID=2907302 RepID=UPI001F3AD17B|nr:hypothetical protein [Dyadobacter sp. CY323]MCE6989760.1 hypothetical protein [Dyadobacter sp. CY323]